MVEIRGTGKAASDQFFLTVVRRRKMKYSPWWKAYSYTVTESQGPRNEEVRHLRRSYSRFSITKTTKERVPALPFLHLKEKVLGKQYELSLVIVGDKRAKALNRKHRGKTYSPNVLAFPLSDRAGEIFLNLKQAKREHHSRGESYSYFVALLFVHALLHLKGSRHGSTMESEEVKLLSRFHITTK